MDHSTYSKCEDFLKIILRYYYEQFLNGFFVIKENQGRSTAVIGDLKLEQTINRSQKSVGGIIGQTR